MENNNITLSLNELKELGKTIKESMNEAADKIEAICRKTIQNPLQHTEENYTKIIWKVMADHCIEKARTETSNIIPNTDIEA